MFQKNIDIGVCLHQATLQHVLAEGQKSSCTELLTSPPLCMSVVATWISCFIVWDRLMAAFWLRPRNTLLSHVGILSCHAANINCMHSVYEQDILAALMPHQVHNNKEKDWMFQRLTGRSGCGASIAPSKLAGWPPTVAMALVRVYCGIAWLGFLLLHDIVWMTYGPSLFTSQPLSLWEWGWPVFPYPAKFIDRVYLCLCESIW